MIKRDKWLLGITLLIILTVAGIGLDHGVTNLKAKAETAANTPLTAPAPILDEYEVRFARSSKKAHITEFKDSHEHHCVMGVYGEYPVLSCEGH